jgi:hypothetical protein
MNDLIQYLPSPSAYSGNDSHMDREIMDGWRRGVGDDDGDGLLQIPIPAGCQNGVSGSESRFLVVAAQRDSIWEKRRTPDVFRSEGIYRRKEGSRRWLGWPHHPLARPGLACATRWCEPLVAPLCLVFWLHESSGKIGVFRYFLGFFPKVEFLHKKRDTRAILLKTTLVHVSCIQNTQIKGKTTAKGFRKVDTFWTYHGSHLLNNESSDLMNHKPCTQIPLSRDILLVQDLIIWYHPYIPSSILFPRSTLYSLWHSCDLVTCLQEVSLEYLERAQSIYLRHQDGQIPLLIHEPQLIVLEYPNQPL